MRHAVRQRPDGDAVAVEDQGAVRIAACPPSRQGLGNRLRNGEHPPHQRLRARGRESDDASGYIDLAPGEAEDLVLAPAGVVGHIEDVPATGRAGWARTARYSGCSKKPWRGGFSRRRSGKPGTVSSQPQWTASVSMRWRAEVSRLMVPGGRPGRAPGELVLADLVGGQRGGPRGAAEERGEMGDPAAGGALGPELPHLIVLEVGVAEISQGRPLGAERARERRRRA